MKKYIILAVLFVAFFSVFLSAALWLYFNGSDFYLSDIIFVGSVEDREYSIWMIVAKLFGFVVCALGVASIFYPEKLKAFFKNGGSL